MKYLFYVSSPLQLICAFSLIDKLQCDNYKIMIFVHDMSSLTYLQILGVAEFYGINPKLLQHFILSRNQLVNLTKITLLSLYQRILNLRHSIVFAFADFYNTHFQLARLLFDPDTTYLLDDGFSSFKAISTEINDGRFIPSDSWISNNTILSYLLLKQVRLETSLFKKPLQLRLENLLKQ